MGENGVAAKYVRKSLLGDSLCKLGLLETPLSNWLPTVVPAGNKMMP